MSRSFGGWAPYVPVAARRRKAEREVEKLRKRGAVVSPVKIEGRQIARTFWGKAWCSNLEGYRDYENRLPRGRTYVRNGSVVDLQIAPREVTAVVSGSKIYKVKVSIGDLAKARWKTLCADCSGGIDSLVELLQGRFSKGVMERICRQDTGLFPRHRKSASLAVAWTMRRCASTSQQRSMVSACGSMKAQSCCFGCARSMRPNYYPIWGGLCQTPGRRAT
jgi:hypothetical protein